MEAEVHAIPLQLKLIYSMLERELGWLQTKLFPLLPITMTKIHLLFISNWFSSWCWLKFWYLSHAQIPWQSNCINLTSETFIANHAVKVIKVWNFAFHVGWILENEKTFRATNVENWMNITSKRSLVLILYTKKT